MGWQHSGVARRRPFVGAEYGWNRVNGDYADDADYADYADTARGGEDSPATRSDPRPSAKSA